MKASELMIGDLVIFEDRTHKITDLSLCIDGTVLVHVDGLDCHIFEHEISDIPLTEEMLKANGFEYDEQMNAMIFRFDSREIYIHIEYVFCINRLRVSADKFRCGYAIDTEIRYVHELQHALRLCGLNDLADNFKTN